MSTKSIYIFQCLNSILAPLQLFLSQHKHNRRTRPEKGQGMSSECGAEAKKINPNLDTKAAETSAIHHTQCLEIKLGVKSKVAPHTVGLFKGV